MLAALIIVFREIFEAGLVVGIVAAPTRAVAGHTLGIMASILSRRARFQRRDEVAEDFLRQVAGLPLGASVPDGRLLYAS